MPKLTARAAAALRRLRHSPLDAAPSAVFDVALPCPPDANMARKMATVDALHPSDRALVHEIGLLDFARRHPLRYKAAKGRAGVRGRTRRTQHGTRATRDQPGAY